MRNQVDKVLSPKTDEEKEDKNDLVFSYLAMRNLIGIAGLLLPIIIALFPARKSGFLNLEPSISDYYYTDRGDILVVTLCILGVFLFTYKGYRRTERVLTIIAGISAIGVAFVPTKETCKNCEHSVHQLESGIFKFLIGTEWHFIFAAAFLLSLAIISIYYFTRSNPDSISQKLVNGQGTQKAKRNRVYRICGFTMIASVCIIGLYFIVDPDLNGFPVVYVFETIAVWAFALSWFTKGQTLWPDNGSYLLKAMKTKGK